MESTVERINNTPREERFRFKATLPNPFWIWISGEYRNGVIAPSSDSIDNFSVPMSPNEACKAMHFTSVLDYYFDINRMRIMPENVSLRRPNSINIFSEFTIDQVPSISNAALRSFIQNRQLSNVFPILILGEELSLGFNRFLLQEKEIFQATNR